MTEALARCLEILLGIDAGRRGVDLGNGDLHPGLERAKLFETFARLKRRWWQRDEGRQRIASPPIDADMVVFRCRAGRHRRAATRLGAVIAAAARLKYSARPKRWPAADGVSQAITAFTICGRVASVSSARVTRVDSSAPLASTAARSLAGICGSSSGRSP